MGKAKKAKTTAGTSGKSTTAKAKRAPDDRAGGGKEG